MIEELKMTWPRILKIWVVHLLWAWLTLVVLGIFIFLIALLVFFILGQWLGLSASITKFVYYVMVAPFVVVSFVFPIKKIMNRNFKDFQLALLSGENENIIVQETWFAAAQVTWAYMWRFTVALIMVGILITILGYILGAVLVSAGVSNGVIEALGTIAKYVIGVGLGVFVIRALLFVQFRGFRLAIVKKRDSCVA